MEQTLVLIKPDGVQRGLVGEILQRFEKVGLKISGTKMVLVDKDFSKQHYAAHVGKDFYPGLEKIITEGPVIAFVLEGIHAVEIVRKMVGATEPKEAAPGTIRGDYAQHSYAHSKATGLAIKNLIHASATLEEAEAEVALWFAPEEIHVYNTDSEKHVF